MEDSVEDPSEVSLSPGARMAEAYSVIKGPILQGTR